MVEGYINLNANVTMLASEADKFANGIIVDHLVNIRGNDFTINANNLGRIFNVTSTAKLNIYSVNLINGMADIGGAIYNTGYVYALKTTFRDNTANKMGGAAFNKGTLDIEKCIINGNDIIQRTSSKYEDYGGAAVYNWYDSKLTIKNSTISNNLKNYKNGDCVVGAVTSLGKTIISKNSYFINNSGRWGGAITTSGKLIEGNKVNELSISDSTFSENGGLYGAGIFVEGSNFVISNSVFDKNSAFGKGDMSPNDNDGAAIVVTDTDKVITGTIKNTKFTNNKAQYGGAVDICAGNIKITNSEFINNSADVEGGAIDINTINCNPEVTISGSKFINNSASYGGAIVNIKDLTVKNSEFINNTPDAIFNWVGVGGNLDLDIKTFTDLQNAIDLVSGTLTLNQDVAMTDDEASSFVNGVTINKDIEIDGKGHTIDARDLGRIFNIVNGATVTLTNATLTNGRADKFGGAIYNNGDLTVKDVVFNANDITNRKSDSVDHGGAAIYNWYDGKLTVIDSNFTNNIKNYKNGDRLVGAVATIGDATITGSYFANNSGRWGGAISTSGGLLGDGAVSTLTVINSVFEENGGLYGAGIFIWESNFVVSDSVFDKNSAFGKGDMTPNDNDGAAIVVTDSNKVITGTIKNTKFTNNKAQYGGAVDICAGNIAIENSEFINNSAEVGGAIDIDSARCNPEVTISGSKFINNSASYGGAIGNVKDLTVKESIFVNNSAFIGEVIYNTGSIGELSGNSYEISDKNKAPIYNNGIINTAVVSLIVLDNKTVNIVYGQKINLTALVYVDGVLVSSNVLTFEIEGKTYMATSLLNGTYIVEYTADNIGQKVVNATYNGFYDDVNVKIGILNVTKIPTTFDVDVKDINVGDLQIITVNVPKDATGIITVTVDGKDYTLSVYDGKAVFYYPNLDAGSYDVSISYSGDKKYLANTTAAKFNVNKLETVLDLNIYGNIVYGNGGVIIATLPSDIIGELTININGKDYTVAIVNGVATLELPKLDAGDYKIAANYAGNDKYLEKSATIDLNIAKANANLNVIIDDVNYNNVFIINAVLTGVNNVPLAGNVIVSVNGKDYTVVVVDGKGTLTADKLATGTYDFVAAWAGNDNYNGVNANGDFKVNKINSTVVVDVNDIKVGEDAVITVSVPVDATGNVVVTVDGKNYTLAIVDGKAVIKIGGLKEGNYAVNVKYSGDNNYNANQNTAKFTVSKVSDYNMTVDIADIIKGENATITVTVPEDGTGSVIVTINGTDYKGNVVNGTAKVIIPGLDEGTYKVVTFFTGDNKYDSMIVDGTITVNRNTKTILTMDNLVKYFKGSQRLTAKLVDGFGNPIANATVYFTINGVVYAKITDENGTASMGIGLVPNEYKVSALFKGTDDYDMATVNATVLVKNTILGNDTTLFFRNGTAYMAKFLDSDGKALVKTSVKFNINGVFYNRVTDENGIASLNIKLDPNSYVITAYNPVTGEERANNVTVLPRLTAKDLSMNYLDGSVFNATLVDGQGKAVSGVNITFNVNGVFYHRTTNENGVASLNIRLMPGDYIITSMYDECWASNKITISA